jgi:transposase
MVTNNFALLKEREKIELLYLQGEKINLLEEEIRRLKIRLDKYTKKNSKNSNKPSSTDQSNNKTQSLRKKSGKKLGGQLGHKGYNLKFSKTQDEILYYSIIQCACCGCKLDKKPDDLDRRQVFEVPKPKISITEHQAEIKICAKCGNTNIAQIPSWIISKTQYGPEDKSLMVYLSQYQLLPYQRIRLLFKTIYNHIVSAGTVYNAVTENGVKLQNIDQKMGQLLVKSPILHGDESGINIGNDKHWLHVASNEKVTHYSVHKSRGFEAMEEIGIFKRYQGIMIHDHWRSYFRYTEAKHALCNAHHLRELKYINEVQGLKWAKTMSDLLIEIYDRKQRSISRGWHKFYSKTKMKFIERYMDIIHSGQQEQSFRGTLDSKNLLKRLKEHYQGALLFMENYEVPFTNNQGERDIRMIKVHQKITGGFRTISGAKTFCINRGVISTAIKNGKNILNVLRQSFLGKLKLPQLIAAG